MLVVEGIGFPRESEAYFGKHKRIEEAFKDRLLICSPVKNKVDLVNLEINSGLGFKEGEEYSGSLFVRSAYPNLIQKKRVKNYMKAGRGMSDRRFILEKKLKINKEFGIEI